MALIQEHKKKTSKDTVIIPVRMQRNVAEKLDLLVERLHAKSRNEIIRNAINEYTEQLMNTKIIEMRDVSVDEAVKLIDKHISKHPGKHYVSEVSEALGIELNTAFKATQKLIESGSVTRRD